MFKKKSEQKILYIYIYYRYYYCNVILLLVEIPYYQIT